MSTPDPKPEGELMREAAFWFARMRGPEADASRAEFDAWLVRGALHRTAYNRIAEIFAMGKILAEPIADLPVPPPRHRVQVAALAVAVLALLAGTWLVARLTAPGAQVPSPVAASGATPTAESGFATGPGRPRTVELPDGSIARLDGGTRLTVRFDAGHRTIGLASGTARFEVRHDGRPFIVRAGGGEVIARGTTFVVSLSPPTGVRVRLLEGAVDVRLPGGSGVTREIRRLTPGESLTYAAHGADLVPNAERDPAAAGPAAANVRDFDDMTLAELLADANLGATRPIRLADPALGQRRVSGRLRVDDTERLADHLAALLGLRVDRSNVRTMTLHAG